jgi:hypothetical protein
MLQKELQINTIRSPEGECWIQTNPPFLSVHWKSHVLVLHKQQF